MFVVAAGGCALDVEPLCCGSVAALPGGGEDRLAAELAGEGVFELFGFSHGCPSDGGSLTPGGVLDKGLRGLLRSGVLALTLEEGGVASGIPSRASNKTKQATRAASWQAAQKRKETRIAVQHDAALRNSGIRRAGGLTPWEEACRARAERRVAAGCRARWEAAQRKKEQIPAAMI